MWHIYCGHKDVWMEKVKIKIQVDQGSKIINTCKHTTEGENFKEELKDETDGTLMVKQFLVLTEKQDKKL